MKKVFTLFFAIVLFSAAAFAQEHRFQNENRYNDSRQYQSSNNGYEDFYNKNWDNGRHNDRFDRDRRFHKKEWYGDRRFEDRDGDNMIFRKNDYYDNYDRNYYRHRRRLALQIVIGRRDRF